MKSLPVGAELSHATDGRTKLVVVFRNFANKLKKRLPAKGMWGDASSVNTETSWRFRPTHRRTILAHKNLKKLQNLLRNTYLSIISPI